MAVTPRGQPGVLARSGLHNECSDSASAAALATSRPRAADGEDDIHHSDCGVSLRTFLRGIRSRTRLAALAALLAATWSHAGTYSGPVIDEGVTVELRDVIQLPATSASPPLARIGILREVPDGTGRLFVNDLRGPLYVIRDDVVTTYLDMRDLRPSMTSANLQLGLVSFAFHPGFATNGLLYTAHTESVSSTPTHVAALPAPVLHHAVVTEWQVIDPAADVFAGTPRELMRIASPHPTHNLGEIAFDPTVMPTDPDYGLLYIAAGDFGSVQRGDPDQVQRTDTIFGAILRIDPLGTPFQRDGINFDYGVPPSNPFVADGDPQTFGEIFAYGFRNPQNFHFDRERPGVLYVAEIGQGNIEEVELPKAGTNHGWPEREGTFALDVAVDRESIFPLPANDADFGFTYPPVQYDHDEGIAIAGGLAVRGARSELSDKFVFGDIVTGRLLYADIAEMLAADDGDPSTTADVFELNLVRDGNETTLIDVISAELGEQVTRADLRFSTDRSGRLLVSTKQDGYIRQLIPTPVVPGDFNNGVPDQDISGGRPSHVANDTVTADDIDFDGGTIRGLRFLGTYIPVSGVAPEQETFVVRIYDNDGAASPASGLPGGLPGTLLHESVLTGERAPSLLHLQPDGETANFYVYSMNLVTPITLPAGDYWLAVRNDSSHFASTWNWGVNTMETPVGLPTRVLAFSADGGTSWAPGFQDTSLTTFSDRVSTLPPFTAAGMVDDGGFDRGLDRWQTTGAVVAQDGVIGLDGSAAAAAVSQSIDTPLETFELHVDVGFDSPGATLDVLIDGTVVGRVADTGASEAIAGDTPALAGRLLALPAVLQNADLEFRRVIVNDPAVMGRSGASLEFRAPANSVISLDNVVSPRYATPTGGVRIETLAAAEGVSEKTNVIDGLVANGDAVRAIGGVTTARAAARAAAVFGGAEAGVRVEISPPDQPLFRQPVATADAQAVGLTQIESATPDVPIPLDYNFGLDGFIDIVGSGSTEVLLSAELATSRAYVGLFFSDERIGDVSNTWQILFRRENGEPARAVGNMTDLIGDDVVTPIPGGERLTAAYQSSVQGQLHVQSGGFLQTIYSLKASARGLADGDTIVVDFFNTADGAITTEQAGVTITQLDDADDATIVASVLPTSRSVRVDGLATAFATILNAGSTDAVGCGIDAASGLDLDFAFQTTDPLTNGLVGQRGFPVDIPAGEAATFVVTFDPTGDIEPSAVPLVFDCVNTQPAGRIAGVNDLALSADYLPVADVIALAATIDNDGIAKSSGTGVFSVATANVGADATIVAKADTGGVSLPLSVMICETNPASGECLAAPVDGAVGVSTSIAADATPTFGIFITTTDVVPLDPATNRVFVRFADDDGKLRGSTSVAVQTR